MASVEHPFVEIIRLNSKHLKEVQGAAASKNLKGNSHVVLLPRLTFP